MSYHPLSCFMNYCGIKAGISDSEIARGAYQKRQAAIEISALERSIPRLIGVFNSDIGIV